MSWFQEHNCNKISSGPGHEFQSILVYSIIFIQVFSCLFHGQGDFDTARASGLVLSADAHLDAFAHACREISGPVHPKNRSRGCLRHW